MRFLADSLSWTTFGIAVGGAGLALILLLAALARRRPASAGLEAALRESSTRVESMISDLSERLDQTREQGLRSRKLAEIGTTIDLDEVLARTLETARGLVGVDAVAISLEGADDESPVVASIGLSDPEASLRVAGSGWGERRAAIVSYLYPRDAEAGEPIRGSAHVPLHASGAEETGTLSVFWRAARRTLDPAQIDLLEELAAWAGPAIANARRFQEARQLADLDALTGLHNYRYFHETLAREVARAHRYGRALALVVFDIDDFKAINDRIGHLAGDTVLAEAAQRVRGAVRGADIACRVGGDEFAVVLPEATISDAESLYRRLQAALATWRANTERLHLSAGIAELEPEDDALSLFKRADEALYRAKAGGKGQSIAAGAEL